MGWFKDTLSWTSGKLFSVAGHAASAVGAKDMGEFLKMAGDPSYTPKALEQGKQHAAEAARLSASIQKNAQAFADASKPARPYGHVVMNMVEKNYIEEEFKQSVSGTKVGKERQIEEAKQLRADVQKAARHIEIAHTELMNIPETIVTGGTAYLYGHGTKRAADAIMARQGESPLIGVRDVIVPEVTVPDAVPLFGGANVGGDAHYHNGRDIDDHPDRPVVAVVQEKLSPLNASTWIETGRQLPLIAVSVLPGVSSIRPLGKLVNKLRWPLRWGAKLGIGAGEITALSEVDNFINPALPGRGYADNQPIFPEGNSSAAPQAQVSAQNTAGPAVENPQETAPNLWMAIVALLMNLGKSIGSFFTGASSASSVAASSAAGQVEKQMASMEVFAPQLPFKTDKVMQIWS